MAAEMVAILTKTFVKMSKHTMKVKDQTELGGVTILTFLFLMDFVRILTTLLTK